MMRQKKSCCRWIVLDVSKKILALLVYLLWQVNWKLTEGEGASEKGRKGKQVQILCLSDPFLIFFTSKSNNHASLIRRLKGLYEATALNGLSV